jgi:hypothetical protein
MSDKCTSQYQRAGQKIVNKELERQMATYQVQLMQAQVAASNAPKK